MADSEPAQSSLAAPQLYRAEPKTSTSSKASELPDTDDSLKVILKQFVTSSNSYYESFCSELDFTSDGSAVEGGKFVRAPWKTPLKRDRSLYVFSEGSPRLSGPNVEYESGGDSPSFSNGPIKMFNPDCVSEVSTDHGSASITSVIDSINGSVEIPDGASLVTTAQRALRVLYGILAITNSGEEKYWHQIFPQKSVTEACAGIVDFLAEQLPTILESVDEKVECVPLSSQRTAVSPSGPGNKPSPVSVTFDFLHRFADNLEIEHAKRTNSGPMSAAAASTLTETVANACFNHFQAISNHSTANCVTSNNTRLFSSNVNSEMDSRGAAEFDTAGNDALQQRLRLSIKQKSDEISDIEAKILGGAKGNERTALEIRVKQLERSLLNDKIDLSVAASSGEFQAHVNKLHGQVVEVTTRQDKLEERQNEV